MLENNLVYSLWKMVWHYLVEVMQMYDLATITLGLYFRETSYTRRFVAALFMIAPKEKQFKSIHSKGSL